MEVHVNLHLIQKGGYIDMAAERIMIVDDDSLFLEVVTRILSRAGYEVFSAAGPRDALEIIRNNAPVDLVVSDVAMPEMRGTQLVREVVRLSPQTARVLMTGSARALEDVPDDVPLLRKPFTGERLITAVETALARSV